VVRAYHGAGDGGADLAGVPTVRVGDGDLAATLPPRSVEKTEGGAPLNNMLDLLHFAVMRRLSTFDHWWLLEYDTDFSADWRAFFSAFEGCQADLLGTTVYPRALDPKWFFWPGFQAPPAVSAAAHVRGFFPVVRLSRRFVDAYAAEVTNGWRGHFEALYPSIALFRGLRVEDIGGDGPFVPEPRRGRFYWNTHDDVGLQPGTFRFEPAVSSHYFSRGNRDFFEPDRLWHPIKTHRARTHAPWRNPRPS
jgi:hypothetical protein